jgi:hypothetical protein
VETVCKFKLRKSFPLMQYLQKFRYHNLPHDE